MQYFLHSIPESLIDDIGPICMSLIQCCVAKRANIQDKSYEMLDEIKKILSESVVLPHFLHKFQNDRSTDFAYILEGMCFFNTLVQNSTDLDELEKFQYIIQTVGTHLYNYLLYNRKTPDSFSVFLASNTKRNYAGGPQKHMEVVSLDVILNLKAKNA